jgi:hypothetical protein
MTLRYAVGIKNGNRAKSYVSRILRLALLAPEPLRRSSGEGRTSR